MSYYDQSSGSVNVNAPPPPRLYVRSPPPPVVNVARPPSYLINVGPPASSIMVKDANTKPLILALLFSLLFFFIFLSSFCIIWKRRKLSNIHCFKGSSSPSNSSTHGKYDVFLSFRGEDTRDNFMSHLHAALKDRKIRAFIDENLVKGDHISSSLLKTIEDSKISIVILSKDYASSKWCLSELEKILYCKKKNRQIVIPVFYQVDPSDVRNQSRSYQDAFARHEQSEDTSNKVQIWRDALKEVADLAGWDSSITKPESELIRKIANDTFNKLKQKTSSYEPSRVSDDIELGILSNVG